VSEGVIVTLVRRSDRVSAVRGRDVRALAVVNVRVTAVRGVTDLVCRKECVLDRDDTLKETESVRVDSETKSDGENVNRPIVAALPVDRVRVACTDVRPDSVGAVW
jgi:hypothetical protein